VKLLLINPPHLAIGSRIPNEHLPPLGLLAIGGSLIDNGHKVKLLDADYSFMPLPQIVAATVTYQPDAVLLGHSGSTSAQPCIAELSQAIKAQRPDIKIIIGGVFPTYHWQTILKNSPQIDIIVCGEGEAVIVQLCQALEQQQPLYTVRGIAFRQQAVPFKTQPAALIENLDDYRVGWELMQPYQYTYWGNKPAVVAQFSRGCPYPCNYCGQSLFWQKWRHRDPRKFAQELAMLHREYGIEVINFADENPTTSKKVWRAFLEALIAEQVDLILVGSARADNIVRDADILHLYKRAGFERFLLGIESYDDTTLAQIKKQGSTATDKQAIQLLRQHNILSMATYVVGFTEETTHDYFNAFKQLLAYDPDQIQIIYLTPHHWTPYFAEVQDKVVVQTDQRKWDYKHQVLQMQHLRPWQAMLLVKIMEFLLQMRPKALYRLLFHRDARLRQAMRWYYRIGRKVWFYEWFNFLFRDKVRNQGITLKAFWK